MNRAPTLLQLRLDDSRWRDFTLGHPGALPYHHPAWATLLAECYGYRAFAMALPGAGAGIAAGMPVVEAGVPLRGRRWVSLPFTDHCPPLASPEATDRKLAAAVNVARVQAGVAQLDVKARIDDAGAHLASTAVTHTLALGRDPEAVLRTFSRSQVQRNIRKAKGAGLELRRAGSARELTHVFYDLHLSTRRRLGVPVQPRRFFDLFWRRIVDPGLGFVSLVYKEGTPIAGAVFLAWNGTVTYKYGASEPASWNHRPNHLIFWDAIEWSCREGFHTFDFGRSDLEDEGLRAFKGGWGTREDPLTYSTFAEGSLEPSSGTAARLLRPLIRRSPVWVSRGLGELLYKYAA